MRYCWSGSWRPLYVEGGTRLNYQKSLICKADKLDILLQGRKDAFAPAVSALRGRAPLLPPRFRRLSVCRVCCRRCWGVLDRIFFTGIISREFGYVCIGPFTRASLSTHVLSLTDYKSDPQTCYWLMYVWFFQLWDVPTSVLRHERGYSVLTITSSSSAMTRLRHGSSRVRETAGSGTSPTVLSPTVSQHCLCLSFDYRRQLRLYRVTFLPRDATQSAILPR